METKLRVFIGSSSESKTMMRSIEEELSDRGFIPVPWKGKLNLARNTLDELWRLSHEVDFAVFVWAKDSILNDRGRQTWAPRDNVVYEAGLFAGVLSPKRVFLVLEDGSNIKIPSDYLGVGYTSCCESDDGSVQHAAIEIQKAIKRAEQEAAKDDLTREIEGLWTDAVLNREVGSIISTFVLRRKGPNVLDIINGRTWDDNAEPRAKFWSTSSKFDTSTKKFSYSWDGIHPYVRLVPQHFGAGALNFDSANLNRAHGWFSSSPRATPEETLIVYRNCQKATEAESMALLSDNREEQKKVIRQLLNRRENAL